MPKLLDPSEAELLIERGIISEKESYWTEELCPNCSRYLRTDGHYLWCIYRGGRGGRHTCTNMPDRRRKGKNRRKRALS